MMPCGHLMDVTVVSISRFCDTFEWRMEKLSTPTPICSPSCTPPPRPQINPCNGWWVLKSSRHKGEPRSQRPPRGCSVHRELPRPRCSGWFPVSRALEEGKLRGEQMFRMLFINLIWRRCRSKEKAWFLIKTMWLLFSKPRREFGGTTRPVKCSCSWCPVCQASLCHPYNVNVFCL